MKSKTAGVEDGLPKTVGKGKEFPHTNGRILKPAGRQRQGHVAG